MRSGRPVMYTVNLSNEAISLCKNTIASNACATIRNRCSILLGLNNYEVDGLNYGQIAAAHDVSKDYVTNVAKLYHNSGLDGVLSIARHQNSDMARLKLDTRAESHLVAFACTPPPSPHPRWTIALCRDELNRLMEEEGIQANYSLTTVWRALQRNELQPHRSEYWCIPQVTSEFILRMERILHLYSLPYNADYPVICMDEVALQIVADLVKRLDMQPGIIEKIDSEYKRLGTKNIFVFIEPKTGSFYVRLTDSRTAIDWAHVIKHMAEVLYPNAKKIILVLDNLNTHVLESLYKAFPPEEARCLAERLKIFYTPVHGSWLNTAEIAINILKCECIGKRFKSESEALLLAELLAAWQEKKNANPKPINWRFSVEKAREKSHLYRLEEKTCCSQAQMLPSLNEACNELYLEEPTYVSNSLISTASTDDGNIIDLCCSVDENGNEYWAVSLGEKKVVLREPIGKRQIAPIVKQRNTTDGWSIPLPCMPRKSEEAKAREIRYDFEFMANGEDVMAVYSMPYDEKNPVICITKRAYDEKNLSNNGWIANLSAEPKKKKSGTTDNATDVSQTTLCEEDSMSTLNQVEADSRLGFTLMYEPHTGAKYFRVDYDNSATIAECIKELVDDKYPDASTIHLIMCEGDFEQIPILEEVFSFDEALRLSLKIEAHIVPNSGRWLNFAEDEAIVIGRRCLLDGVASSDQLVEHLVDWSKKRTYVKLNVDLQGFRKAFSNVYRPVKSTYSGDP